MTEDTWNKDYALEVRNLDDPANNPVSFIECSAVTIRPPRSPDIMQGSRKPLLMWFPAMWWVCTQKTGVNAGGLKRILGLISTRTAWALLHKLRRAMIRAGREKLSGRVQIDDAFIRGKESAVWG